MKKQLYIKGEYVESIEDLIKLLKTDIYDEGFREQILDVYDNGRLQDWLEEKGKPLEIDKANNPTDDKLFKAIYQCITGETLDKDLHSEFNKYVKLTSVYIDGEEFNLEKKCECFDFLNKKTLSFIFNSSVIGQKEFDFSLRIGDKKSHLKEGEKFEADKPVKIEFDISNDKIDYKDEKIELLEGNDNVIWCVSPFARPEEKIIYGKDKTGKKVSLKIYPIDKIDGFDYVTELITKDECEKIIGQIGDKDRLFGHVKDEQRDIISGTINALYLGYYFKYVENIKKYCDIINAYFSEEERKKYEIVYANENTHTREIAYVFFVRNWK